MSAFHHSQAMDLPPLPAANNGVPDMPLIPWDEATELTWAEIEATLSPLGAEVSEISQSPSRARAQPPPPPPPPVRLGDVVVPPDWHQLSPKPKKQLALQLFGTAPYEFTKIQDLHTWLDMQGIPKKSEARKLIMHVRRMMKNCVYAQRKRAREEHLTPELAKQMRKEIAALKRENTSLKRRLAKAGL